MMAMEYPFNVNPDEIYTIDQVSKIIRIGRQTVEKAVKTKALASYKVGGRKYRITGEDLLKYLNRDYTGVKR